MEELGKSIPAAEVFVEAETPSGGKRHNEFCLNCGTKLVDIFCQHCGQKDIPKRQTLGELWMNFISSFWSYEEKFFKTAKFIVIKPGFLAVEYCEGRRESYFHPARMYVFISFIFFLVFFSLPDDDPVVPKTTVEMDEEDYLEAGKTYNRARIDSLLGPIEDKEETIRKALKDSVLKKALAKRKKGNTFSLGSNEYKTVEQYDSIQKTKSLEKQDGSIERYFNKRAIELNKRYDGDMGKFGDDFKNAFKENFSKVLFWLLPIFALLLKLLYVRRDYFYSEHMVFSVYFYNFFFIGATLQLLAIQVPWLEWLGQLIGFWIFFYLLFAMKRMYRQRWGKTIVKFILFTFTFMMFMGIGLLISALAILVYI